MSVADEIEARLRALRAERLAQKRTSQTRQDEGIKQARGFIELMSRHRVQPEPVYVRRQEKTRRQQTVDIYTSVDRAWVVKFSLSEYIEPWLILCLRPDGKMFDCSAEKPGGTGHLVQGLAPRHPKSAFRNINPGNWVLYVADNRGTPELSLRAPYLGVDDYAKAADWYLA